MTRFGVIFVITLVACAAPATPTDDPGEDGTADPTDSDGDSIPDQIERQVMDMFGPELNLPPDSVDWTRPANVDWFLPQVHLRFDHANCPDDGILDRGEITFANLSAQQHHLKNTLPLCSHMTDTSSLRASNKLAKEFFLQAEDDDATHPGIPPTRSAEWRAYIHVRPSSYVRSDGVAAAYDVQVWNFYAYNDFIVSANHEADWEHQTISVSADLEVVSVYLAAHHGGARFDDATQLAWNGTHVIAFIADGSHATYATAGAHDVGLGFADHTYEDGPVWRTWENYANLGERGAIMGKQTWAKYGGRWGEVGDTEDTSGPVGPMFHGEWDTSKEY